MSVRSRSYVFFMVAVLIGSLALLGCPKRPEVGQAGPGAVGPAAATVPAPSAGAAAPQGTEVPVTRATPPAEAQVAPGAGAGAAAGAPGAAAPGAGAGATGAGAGAAAGAPGAGAPGAGAAGAGAGAAAGPAVAASPLKDIFFDFDKSAIRDDQKGLLNENVSWLKQNAASKITLEGHCDERGSNEYNLALGERRAKAVKDYLLAAGVAADRVATVSYGEERPFVLGHDESAWKWNRRGHFVITGK